MRKPANDNAGATGATLDEKLDLLLAEQKLVLEQLAKVTEQLRARKARTQKRLRTIRERNLSAYVSAHEPTDSDRARARKILAQHRR